MCVIANIIHSVFNYILSILASYFSLSFFILNIFHLIVTHHFISFSFIFLSAFQSYIPGLFSVYFSSVINFYRKLKLNIIFDLFLFKPRLRFPPFRSLSNSFLIPLMILVLIKFHLKIVDGLNILYLCLFLSLFSYFSRLYVSVVTSLHLPRETGMKTSIQQL